MLKIATLQNDERSLLFENAAQEMNLPPSMVEKDFWVCFLLDHLFHKCKYKTAWVFKGGTSLSKSYHVIERFSEDIDLILDWREIIKDNADPWGERSKTKQDQFNKKLNLDAALFYRTGLIPTINSELSEILGSNQWCEIDAYDEMVVNFYYPQIFEYGYLRPCVRLEIGPLAEWTPSHLTEISPFVAEKHPDIFEQPTTTVLTVDAERTFWEKLTILHKIANFPPEKRLPPRYARHLYDVYCMGHSWIKEGAFSKKELLQRDITFKQKFYYSQAAHYEKATLSEICIVPPEFLLKELNKDYISMGEMIYGKTPDFTDIISYLESLQREIHNL